MENVTSMTAEQEQEARAMDEVRERAAETGARRVNPGLVAWLAQRERLFGTNVRGDLQNAPERHPDVMLLKRLFPQSSTALHVRLAWLCWRARQVRFFHPGSGSRLHIGSDVLTWTEALESADERDAIHDEAFAARAAYYAQRPSLADARNRSDAEEEAVALTLMRLPTQARGPSVDLVATKPITPQDLAQRQAASQSAAKAEEVQAARVSEHLTQVEEPPTGVRIRKHK